MSHDLSIERLMDGTPVEVFDAFTDAEAMKEWYQGEPDWNVEVRACDVRVGGTTIIAFGPGDPWLAVEEMTYQEVERPHRLVYAEHFGTPDEEGFDTVVSITLEAQGDKTLMTLVHTGFPNAEERDAHQGGWPGFLDRLERVVAVRRAA
jgi:uncharacterized protein YndB with AHSA1/START domain